MEASPSDSLSILYVSALMTNVWIWRTIFRHKRLQGLSHMFCRCIYESDERACHVSGSPFVESSRRVIHLRL